MTDQTQTPQNQAASDPATAAPPADTPSTASGGGAEIPAELKPPVDPQKPEGETKPAGESSSPAPELTLESYDLKFGEGFTVDDGLMGEFKQLAVDNKLSPEGAQKFAAMYEGAVRGMMDKLQADWQNNQQSWIKEIDQLPEFQGDRKDQSLQVLKVAMQEFGSPEAADILNKSGIGNHPAVVKLIYNLAQALVEGEPASADAPANVDLNKGGGGPKTAAEIMYPSMTKQ